MSQNNRHHCIILKRIDYAEADRILTILTKDEGKLSAIAKGARRPKSKLAGGIELLSLGQLSMISGRGSLRTITSARSDEVFAEIMRDYQTMQSAFRVLGYVDRVYEDGSGAEVFELLLTALKLFNNPKVSSAKVEAWFSLQLLQLNGHAPDLLRDTEGDELIADNNYALDINEGGLAVSQFGGFAADQIKAWRVLLGSTDSSFTKVKGLDDVLQPTVDQLRKYVEYHLLS